MYVRFVTIIDAEILWQTWISQKKHENRPLTCYFCPKSVKRKDCDDIITMSGVHLYQCMINPIKSHQDPMRNDQVISVNMLFCLTSQLWRHWWRHHDVIQLESLFFFYQSSILWSFIKIGNRGLEKRSRHDFQDNSRKSANFGLKIKNLKIWKNGLEICPRVTLMRNFRFLTITEAEIWRQTQTSQKTRKSAILG